ncbi:hypothetical protein [Gemmiger formicilis]|uniref:hypothetical protein n=1 Tax=Gemmiger formicilis TaxID=745368 RepID=UPI003CCAEC9E
MWETITSRENAFKIKYACAVRDSEKQRAADGLFLCRGPKLWSWPKAARRVRCTPRRRRWQKLPSWPNSAAEIAPHVAEKLSGTVNQGVFACLKRPCRPRTRWTRPAAF